MDQTLEQFLQHLVVERGLASLTVEAYAHDLTGLLAFLKQVGQESWQAVTLETLQHYLEDLEQQGVGPRSRARKLSSVRQFFRFLLRENLTAHNPLEWLDSPKLPKGLPKVLGLEEVERLLAAPDPATPLGQRDDAMLELLYATGLGSLCSRQNSPPGIFQSSLPNQPRIRLWPFRSGTDTERSQTDMDHCRLYGRGQ